MADPLTLAQHLSTCYKADALRSGGDDYPTVSAAFASALAEDSALKTEAQAKLAELLPVDKARGGRDYATHKQIKYLRDAIGA